MGRLSRKIEKAINRFLLNMFFGGVALFGIFYFLSKIPPSVYAGTAALVALCLLIWITKSLRRPATYINEYGYVVLSQLHELEHRHVAMKVLRRQLYKNEIVHHINGNKKNNSIQNLCVMDKEKHEHFHAWLSWKRKKTGKYPSIKLQKRTLINEYGGTLLENVSAAA